MYWKSDPMFVCRLEDKDLPALGGPAEKVRGRGAARLGRLAQPGGSVASAVALPPDTAASTRVLAGPTGIGGPDRAGAGLLGAAGR